MAQPYNNAQPYEIEANCIQCPKCKSSSFNVLVSEDREVFCITCSCGDLKIVVRPLEDRT